MLINRSNLIQEERLRIFIRKAIGVVSEGRTQELSENESKLRKYIRILIEAEDKIPHRSTGINVLEDLLKKIIPQLEQDFKKLTTDPQQRDSFRTHIINAVQNTLAPTKVSQDAGAGAEDKKIDIALEEAEIEMDVGSEADSVGDEEAFIDIEKDGAGSEEEAPPEEEFGLSGEDETGRNMAFQAFEKVEKAIIDSYGLLSNDEDRELFYDYLVTNLKLYFDKFETELQSAIPEPAAPEGTGYEDAKADMEAGIEGGEEGEDLGDEEEEGGLDDLALQEGFGLTKQHMVNLGLDFDMVKGGFFDQLQIAAESKGPSSVAQKIANAIQKDPSLAKDPSGLLGMV